MKFHIPTALLLAGLACSKPGEDSEAKRAPIPEPAPGATVPDDFQVPVELDGKVVQTISAETLRQADPDFARGDHRAWRLDRLLGATRFPAGSQLEAIGADGVGIAMRRPESEDSPLPVVVLTRRGEVVAAVIKSSDPFPDYHGQGGRLRRPGDPMPRLLTPLVRLRVLASPAKAESTAATIENLQLQIGDAPANIIAPSLVKSLPSSTVMGDSGAKRTSWNLHDLVDAAAGEGAMLTRVVGEQEADISAEQWRDTARRPVLQVNRRGQLKFHWLGKDGRPLSEGSVRYVTRLEMRR